MTQKIKGYRCIECGTFFNTKEELVTAQNKCRSERRGCNVFHDNSSVEEIVEETI